MHLPRPFLLAALWSLLVVNAGFGTEPPVSGSFTVDGKAAKLAFVRTVKGDEFDGKPTTVVVMTEKDASKNAKPDFDANFGKFGNALIITVLPDGQIIGCQLVHTALKTQSVSTSGNIKSVDFKNEGGVIQGKIVTESGGAIDIFDQKVEVNMSFKAKAP
jgi:hypothetical protein